MVEIRGQFDLARNVIFLMFKLTHWGLVIMATEIWVNIGLGKGLLPVGTKPLHEPMLPFHK